MNIPPTLEPGSWSAFVIDFWIFGSFLVLIMVTTAACLAHYSRRDRSRRAFDAQHQKRLEAWRERSQTRGAVAQYEAEIFTQQIEVVIIPEPIHSDPPKEAS